MADEVSTHHFSEEHVWVAVFLLLDDWSYACHTKITHRHKEKVFIDAETSEDPTVSAAGNDLFTAQGAIYLLCQAASCVEPVDVMVTICGAKLAMAHTEHMKASGAQQWELWLVSGASRTRSLSQRASPSTLTASRT